MAPYRADGRTTFPETVKKSGTYIIKENNIVVYVGYSAKNLYKTLYRHFQTWNHSQQEVVSYRDYIKTRTYTVRVILCTPNQAERLEKVLILKYQPRDNTNKYENYKLTMSLKKLASDYEALEVIPLSEVPF